MPRFGTLTFELGEPTPRVDLAQADHWAVLVLDQGRPVQRLWLPSPGATGDPRRLLDALVRRTGDGAVGYRQIRDRLRGRLGAPEPVHPPRTCSVVVCTHGRPAYLESLLDALNALDPRPLEVVIVDNAPGDRDCRAQVEAAGARYVREDRKGLDHARRAGIRAARGELIAFTDDDCVPARSWLAALPELFADEAVAAVTGPGFAYELVTTPQLRFEEESGFSRGMRQRSADLRNLDPPHAGQLGAGASMVFRRDVLLALPDPFPIELDAGTPTGSGGDLVALARTIAAGHRVVYDPRVYVLHRHRRDVRSLHAMYDGYGTGLASGLLKLLVEDGELTALGAASWIVRQYAARQRSRARGRADAVDVRIGWDYVRGAAAGPARLIRSRRAMGLPALPRPGDGDRAWIGSDGAERSEVRDASPAPDPPASSAPWPQVSVVIPTRERPQALDRALRALAAGTAAGATEVVVVDDDPRCSADPDDHGLELRVVRSGGAGAAVARNLGAAAARGGILLFLDDDLVADPQLVARHLAEHDADPGAVVIGQARPRPVEPTLAARSAALWWDEHFARKREAIALTFADVLTGNMSIARGDLRRVGGFDPAFSTLRREDWEWGVRVIRAGVPVRYLPEAVADHEFRVGTRAAIHNAVREGGGDALIIAKHGDVQWRGDDRIRLRWMLRHPSYHLVSSVCRHRAGREAAIALLNILERLKLRRRWLRVYDAALVGGWRQGFADGGAPRGIERRRTVEVESDEPIRLDGPVVPAFEVAMEGRPLGTRRPRDLQWHPDVADQLLDLLDGDAWGLAFSRMAPPDPAPPIADVAVAFPWSDAPADAAAALEAAGAVVLRGRAGDAAALTRLVGAASRPFVALVMPEVAPAAAWLGLLRVALDGGRVALALGAVPEYRGTLPPLQLFSARRHRPFQRLGAAPLAVMVRRDRLLELGGFDPLVDAGGRHALLLDLVERVLAAGDVVAYQEASLPGGAQGARVREERQRARGLGSVGVRRAAVRGGTPGVAGFLRLAIVPPLGRIRRTRTRQSVRSEVGRGLFFAWGAAAQLHRQSSPSSVHRAGGASTPLPAPAPPMLTVAADER